MGEVTRGRGGGAQMQGVASRLIFSRPSTYVHILAPRPVLDF